MESVIEFEFVCLVKFSGNLFIADTNNNIIRYLDLNKEEPELQTLELKGVQPPTPKSRSPKRLRRRSSPDSQTIVVDGGLSNEGNIYLKISLPEEYHFSKVGGYILGRITLPTFTLLIVACFLFDPNVLFYNPICRKHAVNSVLMWNLKMQ